MRRLMLLLLGIVAAFALCGVPSAVAANPGVSHFAITLPPDTVPDFCGTGHAVDVVVSIKATMFSAPNQPVDSRSNAEVNVVYTNPQNGATVLRHSAGPVSDKLISGDPAGVHTVETTAKGLSGQLRTADGVVLLGAGYLVLHEVFNGEQFLSRRIVVDKGPHPNIESGPPDRQTDLNLFCDAATAALGLS